MNIGLGASPPSAVYMAATKCYQYSFIFFKNVIYISEFFWNHQGPIKEDPEYDRKHF